MPDRRREQAEALNASGGRLLAAGDLNGAADCFRRAAEAAPDWAEPRKSLGNCYLRAQDPEQAARCYEQALAADGNHLASWNNLGSACRLLGRLEQAEHCLRHAAELAPGDADVICNLGVVLLQAGRAEEAREAFQKALTINPQDLIALNGLGNLAATAGAIESAAEHYQRALAIDPGQAETRLALARQYRALHRGRDAIALLEVTVPANAEACALSVNAALDVGDPDAAAVIARRALDVHTNHRECMYLLGTALYSPGDARAAAAQWETTLAAHPDCAEALSALLYHKLEACAWDGLADLKQRLLALSGGGGISVVNPFTMLVVDLPGKLRLEAMEAVIASHYPVRPAPPPRRRDSNGRIRLGYLSGDYRQHPLPRLVRGLFAAHDRHRFEVFAYSLGADDASEERVAIRAAVDHFRDLEGEPDHVIAQAIRGDGIDILIDLSGFSECGRPGVVALRPAPTVVNWLGFIGTMGSLCDVILADAVTIPPGEVADFGERVVRLSFFQPNDGERFAALPAPPARSACGLPEQGTVFCCFSSATKLNPEMLDAWADVLRGVPDSVLWLMAFASTVEENLNAEWARRGMATERLVFARRLPQKDHLARISLANIILDTLPMSNGVTAADALFMGVPLLTCTGTGYGGRMGSSIATAAGLPDMVMTNMGDYVRRAIELGNSPPQLAALKERLRRTREQRSAPLFRPEALLIELEAAFEALANSPAP
jgi:predicted O-linked N-acetylglucosamine transferase (SPINDLY family)